MIYKYLLVNIKYKINRLHTLKIKNCKKKTKNICLTNKNESSEIFTFFEVKVTIF